MGAILKRWNGSVWEAKPLKYWNGSAWVTKQLKYWNGSAWIGGAVAYADNFDRANANLEASPVASGGWSWTHDGLIAGAFTITSNALKSNTSSSPGSAYKTPDLGNANHYVQYRVTNVTTATGPFACCRLADQNSFVGVRTGNGGSNGQIEVYRRNVGTLSNLYTSAASAVAIGDIIRLECSGTNWTLKKNGAIVTGPTAIGVALNSTGTGMVARTGTVMTFEDFEAGAL